MALIIVQSDIQEGQEELGKALIDVLAARGYNARYCAVIFQRQDTGVFTVDSGYIPPEGAAPLRFAGAKPRTTVTASYNKVELTEKVMKVMLERKNTSMVDMSYALGISNEDWAGRALREIFTDLEQRGLISKLGEKRGTRYLLVESTQAPEASND